MKSIKYYLLITLSSALILHAKSVMVNFHQTPIKDVIHYIAKQTGKNILVANRITGNVDFIANQPIPTNDLLMLLSRILQNRGYTLVALKQDTFMVTRSANAKKMAHHKKSEAGMTTKILPLHYIKPSKAIQKVRYLASQFASLTFDDQEKWVIITDYPDKIDYIHRILQQIDRPLDRNIYFIPLHHANANIAQKSLSDIFKQLSHTMHAPIVIYSEPKSNQLILISHPKDLQKIKKIIQSFDRNNQNLHIKSKVIFLNNAEAKATVKIINGLMKSFPDAIKKNLAIEAKEDINAIVLAGPDEAINLLAKTIKKIDIEQQQVYIKAHIYEISQQKVEKLGIRWGGAIGKRNSHALLSTLLQMGGQPLVLPSFLKSETIDLQNVDSATTLGALIDLLRQNGAINVISEPNILCLNNKKSTVYIGKTLSILTSTVQGNQTTDLARNTYSREDVGMTLEVKPQIASDHKVLLEIKATIEDIDQANTQTVDRPTTLKREVNTAAIVHDGKSVIIGGLLKNYYSKGTAKVPLLGDLPILGPIFRSTQETRDQINVIVMLTPYIIQTSQSLSSVQKRIAKIEKTKAKLMSILERKLITPSKGSR